MASEEKMRKEFASMSNGLQSEVKKLTETVEGIKKKEGKSTDKNLTEIRKEIENGKKEMNEMKSTIGEYKTITCSAGSGKGSGKGHKGEVIDFKVKVTGFETDTYKEPAEKTLNENCAKVEGFVEAFMPGGRNDFAFAKFDSESGRRRFMNKYHSGEIEVKHAEEIDFQEHPHYRTKTENQAH